MKRLLAAFLLVIFLLPVSVLAHSGGTNANGGHREEDGDYHYHHGHPAHEHRDEDGNGDLDCLYNFADKTDPDGKYRDPDGVVNYAPHVNETADATIQSETRKISKEEKEDPVDVGSIILICFFSGLGIVGFIAEYVVGDRDKKSSRRRRR